MLKIRDTHDLETAKDSQSVTSVNDVTQVNQRGARGAHQPANLRDTKVDVKVALCGLWASMLFVFAYVDIFGFWRADIINGALIGKVPGSGFEINQRFFLLTTIYILVPSMMVMFSLLAPARINRTANLVVSVLYAGSVVASAIGEDWTYFVIGSVVEVMLLLAIVRVAWTWPRSTSQATSQRSSQATT